MAQSGHTEHINILKLLAKKSRNLKGYEISKIEIKSYLNLAPLILDHFTEHAKDAEQEEDAIVVEDRIVPLDVVLMNERTNRCLLKLFGPLLIMTDYMNYCTFL